MSKRPKAISIRAPKGRRKKKAPGAPKGNQNAAKPGERVKLTCWIAAETRKVLGPKPGAVLDAHFGGANS